MTHSHPHKVTKKAINIYFKKCYEFELKKENEDY